MEHRSLRAEQRLPAVGFRVILSVFNMPDHVYLHPIDLELLWGAHNAIHTFLRLKPQERITIITDTITSSLMESLANQSSHVLPLGRVRSL